MKGKAAAIAFTSSREHDLLYRHINSVDGNIDVIPQVLLAREDALRIRRLIAHGEKVNMCDRRCPTASGRQSPART